MEYGHLATTEPKITVILREFRCMDDSPSRKELEVQGYEKRLLWSLWDKLFGEKRIMFQLQRELHATDNHTGVGGRGQVEGHSSTAQINGDR